MLTRNLVLMLAMGGLILSCSNSGSGSGTDTPPPGDTAKPPGQCAPLDLSSAPTITVNTTPAYQGNAPLFVYLFRHTEDPFNLNYVGELYSNVLPTMKKLAQDNPTLSPVWTVQLQGADANAMVEDPDPAYPNTVAELKAAASDGYVAFGYHAQHEPTYLDRPVLDIESSSDFAFIVEKVGQFVECKKYQEPIDGTCYQPSDGGIVAIENHFGPVTVVSGLSVPQGGVGFEGRGGSHAIFKLLPDRQVGFGFSDHSPIAGPEYQQAVKLLMTMLNPAGDTTSTMFWMDNVLRLNDTDGSDLSIASLQFQDMPKFLLEQLAKHDKNRPHVYLGHLASKYVYTAPGTSPTIFGYGAIAQNKSPKFSGFCPPGQKASDTCQLRNDAERAKTFDFIQSNLNLLADEMKTRSGSRFLNSEELIKRVAPPDYLEVTADELYQAGIWLLQNWTEGGRPPAYATDGVEFYSLRDALGLFAQALAAGGSATVTLARAEGPLNADAGTSATCVSAGELDAQAISLNAGLLAAKKSWKALPTNIIAGSFEMASGSINAAQLLYAFAAYYVAKHQGLPTDTVHVIASQPVPETAAVLGAFEAITASDTSWSLKPARLRVP